MKKQVLIARTRQRGNVLLHLLLLCCLTMFSPNELSAQGSFTLPAINPFPSTSTPARFVSGDFDNDGDMDILYQDGNSSGVGIAYMENVGIGAFITTNANGSGTFLSGPFNGITFTAINSASTIQYVVDYDHDGDGDIVEQTNNLAGRVLKNNNGSFAVAGIDPFPVLINADPDAFFRCRQ